LYFQLYILHSELHVLLLLLLKAVVAVEVVAVDTYSSVIFTRARILSWVVIVQLPTSMQWQYCFQH